MLVRLHAGEPPLQPGTLLYSASFQFVLGVNVMYSTRASIRLRTPLKSKPLLKCAYATTPYSTPAPHPSRISDADVNGARIYCSNLIQSVRHVNWKYKANLLIGNSTLLPIPSKASFHPLREMPTSLFERSTLSLRGYQT